MFDNGLIWLLKLKCWWMCGVYICWWNRCVDDKLCGLWYWFIEIIDIFVCWFCCENLVFFVVCFCNILLWICCWVCCVWLDDFVLWWLMIVFFLENWFCCCDFCWVVWLVWGVYWVCVLFCWGLLWVLGMGLYLYLWVGVWFVGCGCLIWECGCMCCDFWNFSLCGLLCLLLICNVGMYCDLVWIWVCNVVVVWGSWLLCDVMVVVCLL